DGWKSAEGGSAGPERFAEQRGAGRPNRRPTAGRARRIPAPGGLVHVLGGRVDRLAEPIVARDRTRPNSRVVLVTELGETLSQTIGRAGRGRASLARSPLERAAPRRQRLGERTRPLAVGGRVVAVHRALRVRGAEDLTNLVLGVALLAQCRDDLLLGEVAELADVAARLLEPVRRGRGFVP